MDAHWEPSFVAVGALLGEPLDTLAAAIGAGHVHADELLRALQSLDRGTRARAIARVVAEIATGLDALRIA
jgi:hypothetical protein